MKEKCGFDLNLQFNVLDLEDEVDKQKLLKKLLKKERKNQCSRLSSCDICHFCENHCLNHVSIRFGINYPGAKKQIDSDE